MQLEDMCQVLLYRDEEGSMPVANWLRQLPDRDRARVGHTIDLLKSLGVLLQPPHCKHLKDKIWELRTSVARVEYRILYVRIEKDVFILLHSFIKRTDKTPEREIIVAEQRLADFMRRTSV